LYKTARIFLNITEKLKKIFTAMMANWTHCAMTAAVPLQDALGVVNSGISAQER